MEVSIELDGVQVDRTIPIVYAQTLFLFLQKEVWTTAEVMAHLKVSVVLTKKRLEWLVKQGFISMVNTAGAPLTRFRKIGISSGFRFKNLTFSDRNRQFDY